MQQSEEINELAKDLIKAQAEMNSAKKDKLNPFFKSKYSDLTSYWEACREPLTQNNLCVVQTSGQNENQDFCVVTTLIHSSGQWIKGFMPVIMKNKDPQAMGSAITYARRYALASIVGIPAEDDDAETAMQRNTGEFTFSRGKFVGKTLSEIPRKELENYYKWASSQEKRDTELNNFISHAKTYLEG